MKTKHIGIIGLVCLLLLCFLVLGSCLDRCNICNGTGNCQNCRGTGQIPHQGDYRQCTSCAPWGSGNCWGCHGSGKL